ncbi:MAG: DUF2188 domain-containing protein [Clostridia bacterium]|nr:DUF2188 domain-containing protein [Clostridia bacterium]
MKIVLAGSLTEMLAEYWYIIIPLAFLAVGLLIWLIVIVYRAAMNAREDSEVRKAIMQDEENERKRAMEKAEKDREDREKEAEKDQAVTAEEPIPEDKPEESYGADSFKPVEEENAKPEESEKAEPDEGEAEIYAEEEIVMGTEDKKTEKKALYRVIYDAENKEWMVKKDGAARVIRRVKTKAEALELAKKFAENQDLSLSVQKKDGKFQKKGNY